MTLYQLVNEVHQYPLRSRIVAASYLMQGTYMISNGKKSFET